MRALLLSGAFSLAFTLLLTPLFIRLFRRLEWGQFIRDDGPQTHHIKRGTPTMGGIIVILGSVLGYFFGHLVDQTPPTQSAMLVLLLMVGLGMVGFIDDYTKVRNQRSLGLTGWAKIAGQVIIATAFALLAISFPDSDGQTAASTMVSGVRDIDWLDFSTLGVVGIGLFVIWIIVIVVSTSNAVNVADGLDGLATGSAILAVSSYIIIAFWQFNQNCFNANLDVELAYKCYEVRNDSLDVSIVSAAIAAALVGFLWWNTSPAHIFMGDTGSLGIGGALAGLAIVTRTELLLVLIGGLFLIVTGSVIVQRVYFKLTRGKRIFLMSPLHHHFELKGWAEVTVVVRFWLIAGLFVAVGVGLFYLEWVSQ
jgi:phospho-N-acetylmuramoyl-pentapeptide-transferase